MPPAKIKPKKAKLKYARKYRPIFPLTVYRLARAGMSQIDMARELGVDRTVFEDWLVMYPELREALELARKEIADTENFPDWVYTRLSPQLREVWDSIRKFEEEPNGVVKIEMLLADNGKRVRQQLFLHALCVCRFSPSAALAKVNLTKGELDDWIRTDTGFAELVTEMQWHKGNFFEEMLVELVRQGNPQAVIFANKSVNADKGYGTRSTLDVNVTGKVMVGVVDLGDLLPYLGEPTRLELLEAIRRRELDQKKSLPTLTDVLSRQIAEVPIGIQGVAE